MKDKMVQQKVGGLRRLDLWWESLPFMQPIIFVSGSSSAAASSSFSGDVGSSSSASSAGGVGTSALGAGVSTKKRMRSHRDKGEMRRLPICSSKKLGGGSDVCMKPCVVGRSYEGSPLFLVMTILRFISKPWQRNHSLSFSPCKDLIR